MQRLISFLSTSSTSWTNQLGLNLTELPYGQEVMDARWMIVCFEEPIFDVDILKDYMSGGAKAGYVETAAVEAETSAAASAPTLPSSKSFHYIFLVLASVSLYSFFD